MTYFDYFIGHHSSIINIFLGKFGLLVCTWCFIISIIDFGDSLSVTSRTYIQKMRNSINDSDREKNTFAENTAEKKIHRIKINKFKSQVIIQTMSLIFLSLRIFPSCLKMDRSSTPNAIHYLFFRTLIFWLPTFLAWLRPSSNTDIRYFLYWSLSLLSLMPCSSMSYFRRLYEERSIHTVNIIYHSKIHAS